jgi:hypothetical protein
MLGVVTFAPRCPTCHEPVVWAGNAFRPFCSERCRLVDLGAWVTERYRVPGDGADEDAEDDEGPGGSSESGEE